MSLPRPLTKELATEAIQMVLPAFHTAAATGKFKRDSIYIVVMDPRKKPGEFTFDASILLEYGIGPEAENYKPVARAKARRAWETGLTGQTIQSLAPHLFDVGDTKWHGDAVYMELVVAASGIQGHFDELVSWWVLHAIIALCKDVTQNVLMTSEESFIRPSTE